VRRVLALLAGVNDDAVRGYQRSSLVSFTTMERFSSSG
jgi:hypothetical protein